MADVIQSRTGGACRDTDCVSSETAAALERLRSQQELLSQQLSNWQVRQESIVAGLVARAEGNSAAAPAQSAPSEGSSVTEALRKAAEQLLEGLRQSQCKDQGHSKPDAHPGPSALKRRESKDSDSRKKVEDSDSRKKVAGFDLHPLHQPEAEDDSRLPGAVQTRTTASIIPAEQTEEGDPDDSRDFHRKNAVGRIKSDKHRHKKAINDALSAKAADLRKTAISSKKRFSLLIAHSEGNPSSSPWAPKFLSRLVRHVWFDYVIATAIMLNVLVIGAQTHMNAVNRGVEDGLFFKVTDIIFLVIFSFEIVVRLIVEQHLFLFGPNVRWNLFDLTCVIASVLELSADGASEGASGASLMRVLRLVRVFRLIRVMRFLSDLRKMISGIISTMQALVWAMVLLLLVMFLFAVLVTQMLNQAYDPDQPELARAIDQMYGSLFLTTLYLFQAISGGIDWGDLLSPLLEVSVLFGPLFVLYISFSVFCVLNIVTAVFVEHANKSCDQDKELMVVDEMSRRQEYLDNLKKVFYLCDKDGSGYVDRSDFEITFGDPQIQAYLRGLDIDIESFGVGGLFDLLDVDESGEVDIDTFTKGLSQLKGFAKSFDIYRLQHDVSSLRTTLSESQAEGAIDNTDTIRHCGVNIQVVHDALLRAAVACLHHLNGQAPQVRLSAKNGPPVPPDPRPDPANGQSCHQCCICGTTVSEAERVVISGDEVLCRRCDHDLSRENIGEPGLEAK